MAENNVQDLLDKIKELENKVEELERKKLVNSTHTVTLSSEVSTSGKNFNQCDLNNLQIQRYSRQMILPEISVTGQVALTKSSVLIVGAGGLGCPSAQYLAAAGVGHIGLVDYDVVDVSNLHRQIIHTEDTVGMKKVESMNSLINRLNSDVKTSLFPTSITSENAETIIKQFDVVLDCTDNVATRYLLNDACVFSKKPLVSGSALRFEGQLTVYNYADGPCYRCLYPTPPPAETVTNCSDGGVIGAVTGVIGSLQVLEAIKIITKNDVSYSGKLLLFDGLHSTFRSIKLRGKKNNCVVCSDNPSISTLQDYEQFCGTKASDKETKLNILRQDQRITPKEYSKLLSTKDSHLLIDVRPLVEYNICSLKHSHNIPISDILLNKNHEEITKALQENKQIIFVCKRGNDSQKAVSHLIKGLTDHNKIKDIIGGLHRWSKDIDDSFPVY